MSSTIEGAGPSTGFPAENAAGPDFRQVIESAPEVVTIVEADGRIIYDSPAVFPILGYAQGELVGRNAFEFVHGDDFSLALDLFLQVIASPGIPASLTFRFRHRNGTWRVLESAGQVLADNGSGPRLVITSRDATTRANGAETQASARRAYEEKIREREMEEAQIEMLERLTRAAECRDDDTGQHTRRVGDLAASLAARFGLSDAGVEILRRAAPLHDVGKVGIPDSILLKPGPLAPDELEVMRTHTVLGARILSRGRSPLVRTAEQVALSHHERWDGDGYPQGLSRDSIPLTARIVAVADYFDALTHDRPYRGARPRQEVMSRMEEERARQFDPQLVDAFLELGPPEPA